MHIAPLLLCAALFVPTFAQPVPGYDALTGRRQEIFTDVAKEEFCGCDSELTLLACLSDRPKCPLAGDLGAVLARAAGTGAGRPAVSSFMSQGVLGPFCSPPATIVTTGAPRQGPATAPLQVVEFADFRCTHCREAMPLVHAALKQFAGRVSLTYLPVSMIEPSPSSLAAEAAMAAHDQGKFWPMHAALFAREAGDFTPQVLRQVAKSVGLNLVRYDADLKSHKHVASLARFRKAFDALKLDGTPAMYVNGRRFDIDPRVFDLSARLAMEEHRQQGNCR